MAVLLRSALSTFAACSIAVVAFAFDLTSPTPWLPTSASAQAASEKEAFQAAKELGTVEAWEAFLTNYPTGFHADLARAYVKKLAESPSPAPAPAPTAQQTQPQKVLPPVGPEDYPVEAGSWGGIVRSGPGQQYKKVASLQEGERITLMGRSEVMEGDYPWMKIAYGPDGKIGFKWGGILCSIGAERQDVFKTCPPEPEARSSSKKRKTKSCASSEYLNQNGFCQPNETGG